MDLKQCIDYATKKGLRCRAVRAGNTQAENLMILIKTEEIAKGADDLVLYSTDPPLVILHMVLHRVVLVGGTGIIFWYKDEYRQGKLGDDDTANRGFKIWLDGEKNTVPECCVCMDKSAEVGATGCYGCSSWLCKKCDSKLPTRNCPICRRVL